MSYKGIFCNPFKPDTIDLGEIDKDKILDTFEKIPWDDFINRMASAKQKDFYYSPSLDIENLENNHSIEVSAIDGTCWYIFYRRPKMVTKKRWFKTVERLDKTHTTDVLDQSIEDVRECLNALVEGDFGFLENKVR